MNPEGYRTLGALEDAHRDENAVARLRVERAEEYLSHYRSRMTVMQENFHHVAARQGILDDPGFRAEFVRVTDEVDENVRGASAVVAGLEEDYHSGLARQSEELEAFARENGASY